MQRGLAIELFSCAGGMAEGFRRAGIEFDLVIDKDKDACDSYEANIGHRPVQLEAKDFLRAIRCGFRPGPVRLFVADPPCTPWSTAGKQKGLLDPRDCLVVTCGLIRELMPAVWSPFRIHLICIAGRAKAARSCANDAAP